MYTYIEIDGLYVSVPMAGQHASIFSFFILVVVVVVVVCAEERGEGVW